MPVDRGRHRLLFSRVQAGGDRDDPRARRHCRLDNAAGGAAPRRLRRTRAAVKAGLGRHREDVMPSNVFRFDEEWTIPDATPAEVYEVLAHGEWLPLWWRGVYLKAEKLSPTPTPQVGDRLKVRARGALPYQLDFILEAVELDPGRRVAVRTYGEGRKR